jgi:hypothetical protein
VKIKEWCQTQVLLLYLENNPDIAEAFKRVGNIEDGEISGEDFQILKKEGLAKDANFYTNTSGFFN